MEREIVLAYSRAFGDISEVINKLTVMRDARENVRREYNSQVQCEVQFGDFSYVHFTTTNGVLLECAFKEYIIKAGFPDYVCRGSDMNIVNKVLAEYGKKTKLRFVGCAVGRTVEDIA